MSNPENDQPTIKIGGGGQAPAPHPSPWPGPSPADPAAGGYSYDVPPTVVDGSSGWGDAPLQAPSGPGGFGSSGPGMPPPTIVGGGYGYGASMPPAQQTVLIRPNQKPAIAWLVVADGPYNGHLYSLSGDKMIIGRAAAHIVLGDPAVSGQHAAVWAESDGDNGTAFFIQDLASANGTLVNGEPLLKAKLQDGDRLRLGDTNLIFKQV